MKTSEVISFLNEISERFPNAISLGAGRPSPSFFKEKCWEAFKYNFVSYYSKKERVSEALAERRICEYGPTNGILNGLIKKHLEVDECINVSPKNIVVTNGSQEAIALFCLSELTRQNECMLTIDPSYIGFSGFITAIGKNVEAIDVRKVSTQNDSGNFRFNWDYLGEKVKELRRSGVVAKGIYINPDFNNPLSYRLSRSERVSLIHACYELNLKIIEDNPYSRFDYTESKIPTLKALDDCSIVYHLGSFSKTFSPGLRVGYLVVPEDNSSKIDRISSLKSYLSVSTSTLSQSIIGGFLIENEFSLAKRMAVVNKQYVRQRDSLLSSLDDLVDSPRVTWVKPEGGFFCVVNLPFEFTDNDVYDCAKEFGVICMPVRFFSQNPERWSNNVRLAFSYYDADTIKEGVSRFSKFVNQATAKNLKTVNNRKR